MAKKKLADLKPFKNWKEAGEDFDSIISQFREGGSLPAKDLSDVSVIMDMARFGFRVSLTIENERRKKR